MALAALALPEACSAARVYNMTNMAIVVNGAADASQTITLERGDQRESRSISINWSGTSEVLVKALDDAVSLCKVLTSTDHQIKAGNFVVVTQQDRRVTCSLCDSDQRVLSQDTGEIHSGVKPYVSPQQSCR